ERATERCRERLAEVSSRRQASDGRTSRSGTRVSRYAASKPPTESTRDFRIGQMPEGLLGCRRACTLRGHVRRHSRRRADMAKGWAGEDAAQKQIDATIEDAVQRARSRLTSGPSLAVCVEYVANVDETELVDLLRTDHRKRLRRIETAPHDARARDDDLFLRLIA